MGGSRKFKNKPCVYCADGIADTGDHVFPREIFEIEDRGYIPKVPSCTRCNNEKSKLEHYLLTALPFGGTHTNALKSLSVDAARRLNKNKKLKNQLSQEIGYGYVPKGKNELERRMRVPFIGEKLDRFSEYAGRGLLWHHRSCRVPNGYSVAAFTPSPLGLEFVESFFSLNKMHHVKANLGNGTARYKGAISESEEPLSIWAIQLLGGLTVAEPNNGVVFKNSFTAVVIAPTKHIEELNIQ